MRFPNKGGLDEKKAPGECPSLGLADIDAPANRTERWLEDEEK